MSIRQVTSLADTLHRSGMLLSANDKQIFALTSYLLKNGVIPDVAPSPTYYVGHPDGTFSVADPQPEPYRPPEPE
jgi:hypothetical protein